MNPFKTTAAAVFFLAISVAAQESYLPETGVRSLWIPFKTVAGTPLASIAGNSSNANATTYVISCPTESPGCAIAPNLTLTENPSHVQYVTTNSVGRATLGCDVEGTTSATCSNEASGGGQVSKTTRTLSSDQISFQAVQVTMTMNNTSTQPVTVTVTPASTSSSSTSSSSGAATPTSGPWAMGGAVGAGLLALAAL